jgi:hypothetical protein
MAVSLFVMAGRPVFSCVLGSVLRRVHNALIRAIKEYIKHRNKPGRKFQRVKSAERVSNSILLAFIHAI